MSNRNLFYDTCRTKSSQFITIQTAERRDALQRRRAGPDHHATILLGTHGLERPRQNRPAPIDGDASGLKII